MLTAPYSIYINKRPLRVAFLIEDKPESLAIIDAIFAYNHDRWGGRYNPLVVTDGQMLTDAWWSFLEAVDPGADAAGTDRHAPDALARGQGRPHWREARPPRVGRSEGCPPPRRRPPRGAGGRDD